MLVGALVDGCTLFVDTGGLAGDTGAAPPDAAALDAGGTTEAGEGGDAAPPAWRSKLEAEWLFDETSGTTARDTSGRGHDATLVGGGVWTSGQVRGAISLDGVDDHCTVASAATIDVGGGVTLTAWVRSRAAVSGVNPTIFVFWSSSGPSAYVRVNGRRFQFLAASGFVLAETEVPFGQWAHIALTSDGKNAQWFVNGKASGVGPVTMPLTALRAVYIGQDSSAAQRYNGEIDQLRLFRGVLSVGEVADVMNER